MSDSDNDSTATASSIQFSVASSHAGHVGYRDNTSNPGGGGRDSSRRSTASNRHRVAPRKSTELIPSSVAASAAAAAAAAKGTSAPVATPSSSGRHPPLLPLSLANKSSSGSGGAAPRPLALSRATAQRPPSNSSASPPPPTATASGSTSLVEAPVVLHPSRNLSPSDASLLFVQAVAKLDTPRNHPLSDPRSDSSSNSSSSGSAAGQAPQKFERTAERHVEAAVAAKQQQVPARRTSQSVTSSNGSIDFAEEDDGADHNDKDGSVANQSAAPSPPPPLATPNPSAPASPRPQPQQQHGLAQGQRIVTPTKLSNPPPATLHVGDKTLVLKGPLPTAGGGGAHKPGDAGAPALRAGSPATTGVPSPRPVHGAVQRGPDPALLQSAAAAAKAKDRAQSSLDDMAEAHMPQRPQHPRSQSLSSYASPQLSNAASGTNLHLVPVSSPNTTMAEGASLHPLYLPQQQQQHYRVSSLSIRGEDDPALCTVSEMTNAASMRGGTYSMLPSGGLGGGFVSSRRPSGMPHMSARRVQSFDMSLDESHMQLTVNSPRNMSAGGAAGGYGGSHFSPVTGKSPWPTASQANLAAEAALSSPSPAALTPSPTQFDLHPVMPLPAFAAPAATTAGAKSTAASAAAPAATLPDSASSRTQHYSSPLLKEGSTLGDTARGPNAASGKAARREAGGDNRASNNDSAAQDGKASRSKPHESEPPPRRRSSLTDKLRRVGSNSSLLCRHQTNSTASKSGTDMDEDESGAHDGKKEKNKHKKKRQSEKAEDTEELESMRSHHSTSNSFRSGLSRFSSRLKRGAQRIISAGRPAEEAKKHESGTKASKQQQQQSQQQAQCEADANTDDKIGEGGDDDAAAVATELPTLADTVTTSATMATLPPHELATPLDVARQGHSLSGLGPAALSPAKLQTARSSPSHALQSSSVDGSIDFHTDVEDSKARQQQQMAMSSDGSTRPAASAPAAVIRLESELSLPRQEERDQAARSGTPAAAGGSGGHGQQRRGRSEGPQTESEVDFRMEEEEEPQVAEAAPMPAAVQGQRSPRRTGRHRRRRHRHRRDGGGSGGDTRAEKVPPAQRNASSSASSAGSDDSSYSSDGRAGSTTSLTSADVLRQKERARRRRRRQQQQRDAEAQKREKATKTKTMQSERNGEQDKKTSTRVKAKKRQKTDSASLAHLVCQHTRLGKESPDVYEAAEAYVRRRIARSCERANSRDSASADGEGSRARRADRRRAATDAEELAVSAAQLAARRRALLRQSRVPSTVDHFLVAWHERTAARHRGWLLDAAAVRERKRRAQQLRRERRLRSQDEAVAAAVAAAASRSASRAHAAAATATSPRAAHTPHRPSVTANGNGDLMGDAPVPSVSRRVHSSPRSIDTASMRRLDVAEAALQRQLAELDAHMEKRRRHRLWEERSPSAAAVGARAASGVAQGGEAAAAQQQPQQEGGKQAAASRQHGSRATPSSRAAGVVTPGPSSTAPHAQQQQPASSRASISATTSYAHQLIQSSRRHQGSVTASADREANAVLRSRGDSSPAPRKPPASARFAPLPSRDAAASSSMHNATLYEHQHSPLSALPSAAADREGSEWATETPRAAAAVSTAALQQRYEALLDTLLDEVEREEGAVAEGSRERKETSTGTAGSTTTPSVVLDERKRPSLRQRGWMSPADVANHRPGRYSVSLWNAQQEEEEQALRCAEALRSEFYQAPLPSVAGGANQTSQKDHSVTNTTQSGDHGAAAAVKLLEQLEVSYAQSLRPSCSSCRPQQLDEYVTLGLLSVLHSLEMHNTQSGNGLHSADGTGAQKSAAGEAGAGAHARHKSSQRSSRLLQRGIREELYAAPKPSQRRKRIHQQQLQEEALRHFPHKSLWVGNTVDPAAVALASAPLTRSPRGVPQPAPHPFTPPSTLVFAALLSRLLKAEAQGRQRIEQEEAGEERRTLHRLYIVETVCFLRALHAREQEAVVVVPVLTRRSLRDALARSSDDPHSVHEPVTPAVVQSPGPWRVPAASSSASSGTRSGGDRRHDGFAAGKGAAAGRHSSDSEEGEEESAECGRIDTADRHRRVRSWRGATPPPSPRQHAGHFTDGSDGTSVPRSSRTCTAALESSRGGEAALSSGARSRHGDPDAATQCGSHSDRPAPSPLMPVPMMTSLQQPRETRSQESGNHCDDGGAGAAGKDAPRSTSGGGRLKVSSQTSLCTAAEKNAAPSDLSPQSATEEAERSESAHSWSSSSSSSRFSFASHDAYQPLADSKPVFPDTAKQAEERDGSRKAIASASTEDSSTPLFELQESSRSTSAGEEGSPPSASIAQTPSVRPDEKKVGDSASTDHANAAPPTATEPEPLESSVRHDGRVEKTNNSTEAGKQSTHSPSSSSPSSSSSLEFELDEDDDAEEEKQREDSATGSQHDEATPSLRPAPAADATPLTSTPVMPPLQDGKEEEQMERGDGVEEEGSRSSSASLSAVQERGEDAGVADRVPNAAETTADVKDDESDREVVGAVASASTSPLPPQEAPAPVATSQQRSAAAQSDSEVTPTDAEAPSGSRTALDASRRPLSIDRGDHNSQSANSAATSSAALPSTSSSFSLVSLPLQELREEATDLDKAEAAEEAGMESALAAAATHGRVDDTQNPVDSVADSAPSPHCTPSSPSHQEEKPAINAVDNLDDEEDDALADPFTEHPPPEHQEGKKRDSDEDDDGDRFVVHTRVVEAASASAAVDHAAAATADAPNGAEALMESSEAASAPSTQRGEQPEQSEVPTPSSPSSSMAEDSAQPPLLLQQEQEAEDTAGHTVERVEHDQGRREAADRVEGGQGEQDGSSASNTHGTAETTQQQQQQQQRPRRVRFSLPLEHAHKHHDNGEDNAEEEKKDGFDAADADRSREMGDATGSAQDGLTGVPRDAATPEKLTGRSADSSAEQHSRLTKAQGNIGAEEEEKGGDDDDSVSEKTAVELLEKLNGLDALLLYKFPTYFTKGTDTDGLPGAVMRRGRDTYTPRRSMSRRTSLADAQPAVQQRAADSSGQELPSVDVEATVLRSSNGSAPASGSVSPARAPAGTLQHTNSVEAAAATQAAAAAAGAASPSPSAERSTALAPPRLPAESLATQLRRKYGLRQPRPLTALLPASVSPAASTPPQPGAPALEHVYPRRLSHDVPVLPSPLHTYAATHHPPTAQGAGRGIATALGSAAALLSMGRDVRRSFAAAMTSEDTRRATSESLDGAAPYAPHVKDLPSPEPHPPAQEEEEGGGGRHHQHQHPQYVMRDESVRAEHASEEMRAADSVAAPLVFSSVDRHAGSQRTPPVPSPTQPAGARRDSDKAALLLHQPRENTKEVPLGSHADSDGGAAQAHRGSPPPVISIPATTPSASATLHRVPSSQRVHSDESSTGSDSSPLTVSIGGERKKQQQRSTTTEGAVAVGQSSPPEPPATAPPRRASEWF